MDKNRMNAEQRLFLVSIGITLCIALIVVLAVGGPIRDALWPKRKDWGPDEYRAAMKPVPLLPEEPSDTDIRNRPIMAHMILSWFGCKEYTNSMVMVNPLGWEPDMAETMDKAHLIDPAFGGSNDKRENLTVMRKDRNRDETDPESVAFYEDALFRYLETHSDAYVDYAVKPVYDGTENVPVGYQIQWTGLTEYGEPYPVYLGGNEVTLSDVSYAVWIDNTLP